METALPPLYRIRQQARCGDLENVAASLAGALEDSGALESVSPGAKILVACGSRGIPNYVSVVKALVDSLTRAGADVAILPAMGTHAGGTPQGQVRLLEALGISSLSVGAPVIDTMEVEKIGVTPSGIPVFADRSLLRSDGVILVNRIKDHTEFNGTVQSGLLKMIAVGLGRSEGAIQMHRHAVAVGYQTAILEIARACIQMLPILAGVAMVDGPGTSTTHLEVVLPGEFEAAEPRLLEISRKCGLKLPLEEIDLLIVDEMGKDISGTGIDTKVVGRVMNMYETEPEAPRITRIFVRDLTAATHGNAIGIGLADFTTSRLVQKMDVAATNLNCIAAVTPEKGRIPIAFETDRDALDAAMSTIGPTDEGSLRLVWIQNTNRLDDLMASSAAVAAMEQEGAHVIEGPLAMEFDPEGNLIPAWRTAGGSPPIPMTG